jgi:hypothetical protein
MGIAMICKLYQEFLENVEAFQLITEQLKSSVASCLGIQDKLQAMEQIFSRLPLTIEGLSASFDFLSVSPALALKNSISTATTTQVFNPSVEDENEIGIEEVESPKEEGFIVEDSNILPSLSLSPDLIEGYYEEQVIREDGFENGVSSINLSLPLNDDHLYNSSAGAADGGSDEPEPFPQAQDTNELRTKEDEALRLFQELGNYEAVGERLGKSDRSVRRWIKNAQAKNSMS